MFQRIILSQHCLLKIKILSSHGLDLSPELIMEVVRSPDAVVAGHNERLIPQKGLNEDLILRVVYELRLNEIFVITAYPAKRSRYEKDQIQ